MAGVDDGGVDFDDDGDDVAGLGDPGGVRHGNNAEARVDRVPKFMWRDRKRLFKNISHIHVRNKEGVIRDIRSVLDLTHLHGHTRDMGFLLFSSDNPTENDRRVVQGDLYLVKTRNVVLGDVTIWGKYNPYKERFLSCPDPTSLIRRFTGTMGQNTITAALVFLNQDNLKARAVGSAVYTALNHAAMGPTISPLGHILVANGLRALPGILENLPEEVRNAANTRINAVVRSVARMHARIYPRGDEDVSDSDLSNPDVVDAQRRRGDGRGDEDASDSDLSNPDVIDAQRRRGEGQGDEDEPPLTPAEQRWRRTILETDTHEVGDNHAAIILGARALLAAKVSTMFEKTIMRAWNFPEARPLRLQNEGRGRPIEPQDGGDHGPRVGGRPEPLIIERAAVQEARRRRAEDSSEERRRDARLEGRRRIEDDSNDEAREGHRRSAESPGVGRSQAKAVPEVTAGRDSLSSSSSPERPSRLRPFQETEKKHDGKGKAALAGPSTEAAGQHRSFGETRRSR